MTEKEYITWEQFHKMCITLADFVRQNKFTPKYIYGIPRGGLIPATIISHYLDIPMRPWVNNSDDFLVIDDIADSGGTIQRFSKKNGTSNIRVGTIYVNTKNCEYLPNYHVYETTKWIVFPYERDIDTVSSVVCEEK